MKSAPLVSIVTPVYKGGDYIEELIKSIQVQTYSNFEHIVIDDGSPDDGHTVSVLERYPHLRWWTRENKGQYASLNEGFEAAKGEWITTISHDDRYHDPEALAAIMDFAQSKPRADIVYGITHYIDEHGDSLPVQRRQNYPSWVLQYELFVTHCSMFVKAEKMRSKNLYFDQSLKFTGDADWIMRMQLEGLSFEMLNRIIADYRIHSEQTTTIALRGGPTQIARDQEKARLASLYGKNPFLRKLVNQWVTFDRRKRVALSMLKGAKRQQIK